MKLKELKIGDIFTIENTPSYPKLKINDGYVDMRDDIVNKSGNCDNKDVGILTAKKVADIFEDEENSVKEWFKEKSNEYIN